MFLHYSSLVKRAREYHFKSIYISSMKNCQLFALFHFSHSLSLWFQCKVVCLALSLKAACCCFSCEHTSTCFLLSVCPCVFTLCLSMPVCVCVRTFHFFFCCADTDTTRFCFCVRLVALRRWWWWWRWRLSACYVSFCSSVMVAGCCMRSFVRACVCVCCAIQYHPCLSIALGNNEATRRDATIGWTFSRTQKKELLLAVKEIQFQRFDIL